jgi:hypothetical protein
MGHRNPKGYGTIRGPGETTWLTHRLAWTLAHGAIPEGLIVMHACDNPPCVDLTHLRLGTVQDNTDDMKAKGRGSAIWSLRGERHHGSRMTDDQRAAVVRRLAAGETCAALAVEYGVSSVRISQLRNWTS